MTEWEVPTPPVEAWEIAEIADGAEDGWGDE